MAVASVGFSSPMASSTNQAKKAPAYVVTDLTDKVIKVMRQCLFNDNNRYTGIWNPHNLKKFYPSMPVEHYTGYANPDFFKKTPESYEFVLRDGKLPSDAINDFFQNLAVLDCGSVIQLVYFKAVLEFIGSKKFDFLFLNLPEKFKITKLLNDPKASIASITKFIQIDENLKVGIVGDRPIRAGSSVHFGGVRNYHLKHPRGLNSGVNVICIGKNKDGDQLYLALDFEKEMTEKEIYDALLKDYNKERTFEDMECIKAANNVIFDRNKNSKLKDNYTHSGSIADLLESKTLVGYIPYTCIELDYDFLLELRMAGSTEEIEALLNKKISSIKDSI